jgi:hypothetical protein
MKKIRGGRLAVMVEPLERTPAVGPSTEARIRPRRWLEFPPGALFEALDPR